MVSHEKLNCEQVWRELSNYIDGEVNAALRSTMDEHFKTCQRCASLLAGTRNVVQLYGDERMLEVPAGFSQRLEQRLEQKVEQGRERRRPRAVASRARWSSWSAWMVPLAAMALFAGTLALVDSLTFKYPAKSILSAPGHDIPPDLAVVVTAGSRVFHVAGCSFIHDKATERTITAKEAMQDGYVPCSRCLRQYLKTALRGQTDADDASADAEQDEVIGRAGH
ncbi:MAG: zf-HC2 domain-containing protein [Candidatus Sulfotelmatobacter sp.]|jgi:hypothetical protein